MRDAAADLEFETAARLRDEIKRLRDAELLVADDPMARQEARGDKRRAARARGAERGNRATGTEKEPRQGGKKSGGRREPATGGGDRSRPHKPDLDEMTIRRTEVKGARKKHGT
jgi:excinuclease ABC subunit B